MKLSKTAKIWIDYHRTHSKKKYGIEIVSKVILRPANLSTTQRYLGTISDVEAFSLWMDSTTRLLDRQIRTL